jgi:tripeptide aminopeptidase
MAAGPTAPLDVLPLFLELAALPSPPGQEREVAAVLRRYLRDLGLEVSEDDAGSTIGGSCGNLLARLEPHGDAAGGIPIFLCAHMDTVQPQAAIVPVVADGVVRNSEPTILGADNKATVAALLEAARVILAENRPHAGVELLFTISEETGLQGAAAFDVDSLRAETGFVFDHEGPLGEIVVAAPSGVRIEAVFRGRSAHAGINPEEGRSAIVAAARAIADLRLGRVDEETTANVGTIAGGTARNVIPDRCVVLAEARSRDERKLGELVQEMLDAFSFAAALTECEVETSVGETYGAYRLEEGSLPLGLAETALGRAGYRPVHIASNGGSDANVFNVRGKPCANMSSGMTAIHSPDEHIAVADIEGMVAVCLELVETARTAAPVADAG